MSGAPFAYWRSTTVAELEECRAEVAEFLERPADHEAALDEAELAFYSDVFDDLTAELEHRRTS